MSLEEQVYHGVRKVRDKYRDRDFMAYFQAFSSTFADLEELRDKVNRVLQSACFRAVIFGTRPDCLPASVVDYLVELKKNYDVWVEIGVQSVNEKTLSFINRGHDFACVQDAVHRLSDAGIHCACHVILGLPGEGLEDVQYTASRIAELRFEGVKVHNLHIVEGTVLTEMWQRGEVQTQTEVEYCNWLIEFLRRIPENWAIMRLVSDTPESFLLAPKWKMSKAEFVNYLRAEMKTRGVRQGELI